MRVAPFGNLYLKDYLRLSIAYRSLSRPSSLLRAKASSICPFLLINKLYQYFKERSMYTLSLIYTPVLLLGRE
jgi:hypothetical protein